VVDVFVSLVAEFRDLVLGARLSTSVVVRATAFCLEMSRNSAVADLIGAKRTRSA